MPRRRRLSSSPPGEAAAGSSAQLQDFADKLDQRIARVSYLLEGNEAAVGAWSRKATESVTSAVSLTWSEASNSSTSSSVFDPYSQTATENSFITSASRAGSDNGSVLTGPSPLTATSCAQEDPRVAELLDKDYDEALQIRRALARRSLALEFTEWERARCPIPRLELLYADPARDWLKGREEAHPTYDDFARHPNFINKSATVGGVKAGLKMLVIERLFGHPAITVLLACSHREIRAVRYQDLKALVRILTRTMVVVKLCKEKYHWFLNCYEIYHGRPPPYPLNSNIMPQRPANRGSARLDSESSAEQRRSDREARRRSLGPIRTS